MCVVPTESSRRISAEKLNGSLLLQIEDNGLGIKKEDQARIFEMFYVTNSSNKGTGLGLYITQESVQKMKGKITVDSQLGFGTTFSITLPNQHAASNMQNVEF